MAVNTWLLCGVMTDDHIVSEGSSCWSRNDLINIPSMIKYSDLHIFEDDIHIYANNIGCKIVLVSYGFFSDWQQVELDYYAESPTTKYTTAYNAALKRINAEYHTKLKDFEWVMPVLLGEQKWDVNYCQLPSVLEDSKEYVSLIDCSFIYTCVKAIAEFSRVICNKTSLSKYEQYQLAYYQNILQAVEKPNSFLTNKAEIKLVSGLYSVWSIDTCIENTSQHVNQTITLFSFLSNYQSAYNNELFSSFLTFFGIIVGLEAIYNLLAVFIDTQSAVFQRLFLISIALIIAVYLISFLKACTTKLMEAREFRKKTRSHLFLKKRTRKNKY